MPLTACSIRIPLTLGGTPVERLISLVGLVTMVAIAWAMSSHKRRVPWRIVGGGLALQFIFALLVLKTAPGQAVFVWMGDFFKLILSYVDG